MISLLGKAFDLMDKYKVHVATATTAMGIAMVVMILWGVLDLPLWSAAIPIGVAISCYLLLIMVGLWIFFTRIAGDLDSDD